MTPTLRIVVAGLSAGFASAAFAASVGNNFETDNNPEYNSGFGYSYQDPQDGAGLSSVWALTPGAGVGGSTGGVITLTQNLPAATTPPRDIFWSGFGFGANVAFPAGTMTEDIAAAVNFSFDMVLNNLRVSPAPTGAFNVSVQFQAPDGYYGANVLGAPDTTNGTADVVANYRVQFTTLPTTFTNFDFDLGTATLLSWNHDGDGGTPELPSVPALLGGAERIVAIIEFNVANFMTTGFLPSPLPDGPFTDSYSAIIDNLVLDGVNVVPEPSAAALLAGLGTLGLAALRRRR